MENMAYKVPDNVGSLEINPLPQRSGILWRTFLTGSLRIKLLVLSGILWLKLLHAALGCCCSFWSLRVSLSSCSLPGLWIFGIGAGSGLSQHLPQHGDDIVVTGLGSCSLARINLHPTLEK